MPSWDGTRYSTKAPPLASPRQTRIVTSVAVAITSLLEELP